MTEAPERMTIDFEIYIDDTRYSVPSLYLVSAAGEARARAIATEMLHSSEYHQGVEVRCDGQSIFALGTLAMSPSLAACGASEEAALS